MMTKANTTRLGEAMNARRIELELSWQDIARRSGIAISSINYYRDGQRNPNEVRQRKLERVLRWEHGSIERILAGKRPRESSEPSRDDVDNFRDFLEQYAHERGVNPADLLDEIRRSG